MDTIGENILNHFDEAYEFLGKHLNNNNKKNVEKKENVRQYIVNQVNQEVLQL